MTLTSPSPSERRDQVSGADTGATIDIRGLDVAHRGPRDAYLNRLQRASAEAARLRESLDMLPLATLIVDRHTIDDLHTSFISRAAAELLGLEGLEGVVVQQNDLALAFGSADALLLRMLRELTDPVELEAAVVARGNERRVRITMTVLEADLGDSILCTLVPAD